MTLKFYMEITIGYFYVDTKKANDDCKTLPLCQRSTSNRLAQRVRCQTELTSGGSDLPSIKRQMNERQVTLVIICILFSVLFQSNEQGHERNLEW